MPPSLLALPRELRDQIYDALWSSTPKISLLDHPSQGRILLSYASLPGHETPLPTWLLTSKTLLAEGTAQMTRHGSCIVRLRSDYHASVREGTVLSPPHARRITITLTQPLEGPRPAWPHVVREPVLGVSRENAKCLARVAGHLSSVERAREVRVVLELVREEKGARVDLGALEALCGSSGMGLGIERLEVVVLREQVYRAWSGGFVEAVAAEVKRVGNRIMGSDEDPSVSGVFGDRGFVYAFEKMGGMGLCRVDSAVAGGDC